MRKTYSVNFKLHKRKETSKDEQLVFHNTHEPIISQELWDSAQQNRIRRGKAASRGSRHHRLAGYLYCADCGTRLALQSHFKKHSDEIDYSFRCSAYARKISTCTGQALCAVLAGKRLHAPRKTAQQIQSIRPNLIVDIQAKLQAGKGAGYERWAKVFNLKQMAKTLEYLQEHNLLDYAELAQKSEGATARYDELSAQVKAAEKHMAEIAVLQKHITNYAKMRDIYVAYRKAGYSKKFLEQHRTEIELHKAAKAAFNEQNLKTLPSTKSLRAEYSKLLDEKKAAYAEYRRVRDEMRELLTVKANVDRMLNDERQQKDEKQQVEL